MGKLSLVKLQRPPATTRCRSIPSQHSQLLQPISVGSKLLAPR
eukprot:CAMPEP_0115879344 /NCGR_PEP_ID=MMETSP0287-20121206/27268_1 /TAXON_ID=412157 /ORGANISM="Chrysochromulina rotalis, Strain UIO044" /LENGTH=42 /DNA_ID= /DNA_START= /DNA_END= /DNA_ORIENTATION=